MSYNTSIHHLRARWCLNQDELADLLGISQARISRYEKNEEIPALATALALQVIFNRSPRAIFLKQYRLIEEAVMTRAAEFERSLEGKKDHRSVQQRRLLDAMMARATSRHDA